MVEELEKTTKKIYNKEKADERVGQNICVTMCQVLIDYKIDHYKFEKIIRYIGKVKNVPNCEDMFENYDEFIDMFQELITSLQEAKAPSEIMELFYGAGEIILNGRFPEELEKLKDLDDDDDYLCDPEPNKYEEVEKIRKEHELEEKGVEKMTNENFDLQDNTETIIDMNETYYDTYEDDESETIIDIDNLNKGGKKKSKKKNKSKKVNDSYIDEEEYQHITKDNVYNFKSKNNTKLMNGERYNMYNNENGQDIYDEIIFGSNRKKNLTNSFVKKCKKGDKFKQFKDQVFKKESKAYTEFTNIIRDIFNVESPMYKAFESNPEIFINKTLFEIYCEMFDETSNPVIKSLKESKMERYEDKEMCIPDENDTRTGVADILEKQMKTEAKAEENKKVEEEKVKPKNFADEENSGDEDEDDERITFNDVAKEIVEKYGTAEEIEKEDSPFIKNFGDDKTDSVSEPLNEETTEKDNEIKEEKTEEPIQEEEKVKKSEDKDIKEEKVKKSEDKDIKEEKVKKSEDKDIKEEKVKKSEDKEKDKKQTKSNDINIVDNVKLKLNGLFVFNKIIWGF